MVSQAENYKSIIQQFTDKIKPALTGDRLIEEIGKAKEQRKAIAEGFIYENTILMVAADPGLGKSTISTQMAIELSAGIPVFGLFNVPNPVKVLYIQAERAIIEFLERAEVISKVYPIVKENIVVTDQYKVLNLVISQHTDVLLSLIKRDCPDVKVIVVDPIYPMVSGGLSKDEPASMFCKAMSYIQQETGACLFYNHHTSRDTYNDKGKKVTKDDRFYGSQWLKAHVTGSYQMEGTDIGVTLTKKKDNYKILTSPIHLKYNPETELCHVPNEELPVIERVKNFLKLRKIDKKQFDFEELQENICCATRTLRAVLCTAEIANILEVITTNKNKRLYQIKA